MHWNSVEGEGKVTDFSRPLIRSLYCQQSLQSSKDLHTGFTLHQVVLPMVTGFTELWLVMWFKRLWKIKQIIFLFKIRLPDLNQFWYNLHFSCQFRHKYLPRLFSWEWNLWNWKKQKFSNTWVLLPDSHAFDSTKGSLSQLLSQCYHLDTNLLEGCFVFVWQPAGFTGKKGQCCFSGRLKGINFIFIIIILSRGMKLLCIWEWLETK